MWQLIVVFVNIINGLYWVFLKNGINICNIWREFINTDYGLNVGIHFKLGSVTTNLEYQIIQHCNNLPLPLPTHLDSFTLFRGIRVSILVCVVFCASLLVLFIFVYIVLSGFFHLRFQITHVVPSNFS